MAMSHVNAAARCRAVSWSLALSVAVLPGCRASADRPDDEPLADGAPLSLADGAQLGTASYRALAPGNLVVVYAYGTHGSTGWRSSLAPEGLAGGTVTVSYFESAPRPGTAVGAAMVPFLVSAAVGSAEAKAVVVRDARGMHAVPVEAPPTGERRAEVR